VSLTVVASKKALMGMASGAVVKVIATDLPHIWILAFMPTNRAIKSLN